ncbi:MAG: sodium:alanine symporter family protein [Candidatus Adiutrix sp.]|jgi:AGCS family alanine or glycine:cation symporter|nr:sodium:alanine symporter family protein [Candidatus Adiutrix sp.]
MKKLFGLVLATIWLFTPLAAPALAQDAAGGAETGAAAEGYNPDGYIPADGAAPGAEGAPAKSLTFESVVSAINSFVWGPWLLVLLFGSHLFLTFRTGFIQRKIFLGIKLSVTRDHNSEGDVSQFGALTTALASTIGTGNIIGVGTAIALGGPGAVLWMWLTGVLGIATKYAESLIAVKYRVKTENGTMLGGAMFALERGLNMKWLGVLFALFAAFAAFGIGTGVQSNAVAHMVNETFSIPQYGSGAVMAIVVALVLLGGLRWISNVCIALVPFMSVLYVLGCLALLVLNADFIIPAIREIINSALSPRAAGGGFVGAAVLTAARFGIARGLFSNEAGMGSAPIVAAAAKTRNPVRQALVSSTGTFWDTVVICLMTGLVVVSSILANPEIQAETVGMNGGLLTHTSFGQIPFVGNIVLTFGLITFAFSTILGWSYYGERCAEYLFGSKINYPYRVLYVVVTFLGATVPLGLVWDIADTLNALMCVPNIIAVLLLSGMIYKETCYYLNGRLDEVSSEPVPTWNPKK